MKKATLELLELKKKFNDFVFKNCEMNPWGSFRENSNKNRWKIS